MTLSMITSCFERVRYCYSELCEEYASRFPDAQAEEVDRFAQQAFISNDICHLLLRREIDGRAQPLQRHFALKQLPQIELRIKRNLSTICHADLQELPVYYSTSSGGYGAIQEVMQFTAVRRFFASLVSYYSGTSRFRHPTLGKFSYIYLCIAPNAGEAFVYAHPKDAISASSYRLFLTSEEFTILKILGLDRGTTKRHITKLVSRAENE